MRNKLFYLFGAAFLFCSIGLFTACSDDKSDPTPELPGGDGGDEKWTLSGDYAEGNTNALKMTYNGEELTGKKVTVAVDEKNEKATITLTGTEKDLGAMLSGLINCKLTTSSPIPGETEIKLENVELTPNADGTVYTFKGEDRKPTRTTTYEGAVQQGEMTIKITNMLANQKLAGKWNLAPVKNNNNESEITANAPLWIDWDSNVKISLGNISGLDVDDTPNNIFMLLNSQFIILFMKVPNIQQIVANMLKDVTAKPNGSMLATYSYSGDTNTPAWSSEMSSNIIRYYYGEKPNQIYIEANSDFILNAIGGLIKTRAAANEEGGVLQQLIDALKPALEKGFPCTYAIDGNKMTLHLDGTFTRDLLLKLANVLNDPTINPLIMGLLESDATLAPYAPNVINLLKTLPNALKYHDEKETTTDGVTTNNFTGECTYVNVGFYLEKATEAN